jgi:hypothetical protein
LELEVLEILLGKDQVLDIHNEIKINVNQFYGIEIEEFPAQIAQVALWLVDHQMNLLVRERFGTYFVRIPLTAAASIHHANALTIDWESVVPKTELSYILGNPPFLGARIMSKEQKAEVNTVFDGMKDNSNLDYVTCWYKKAAKYIQGTEIEVAFVSTNSICQGEQVPILWPELINKHGIKINFAHQTFKWSNEARGKAAVYCIIVGFSLFDRKIKDLFQYTTVTSSPNKITVKRINPYLIDAPTVFIEARSNPLCKVPVMSLGNQPIDGGNYLFTEEEKIEFLKKEPQAKKWFRPWIGSHEFINRYNRYFLFLRDCNPKELRSMPEVMKRIEAVKQFRLESKRPVTRELAEYPRDFAFSNISEGTFIVVPEVSSERRKYIPIGFLLPDILASNLVKIIPNATIYHFAVLTSNMHMAWTRYVCGRLKSDYRYSNTLVYNNFPWPDPTDKQKAEIEKAAQEILDTREKFPNSSLADLYDPVAMPPALSKAHQKLDKAVESAYGRTFTDDSQRVAFLFELYQKLSGELFVEGKKRRGKNA